MGIDLESYKKFIRPIDVIVSVFFIIAGGFLLYDYYIVESGNGDDGIKYSGLLMLCGGLIFGVITWLEKKYDF